MHQLSWDIQTLHRIMMKSPSFQSDDVYSWEKKLGTDRDLFHLIM